MTWTVKARRMGTVHIVRWWVTCRDGVEIDAYDRRELAVAYVDYANARLSRADTLPCTPRRREEATTT